MSTSESLSAVLLETQQLLQAFAQNDGFQLEGLAPAFGTNVDRQSLQDLSDRFEQADFSSLPTLEIRSGDDLNGALGAYASETNQIFLSESFWIDATQDQRIAVVLEEIGHSLDTQLNIADSVGDEGAIFSALVRGQSLSEPQLAALQSENDRATLLLDGQSVTVEQASLTVNIAAQDVDDGDTSSVASLLADPGADGLISLREAIAATENTAGADTITFDQAGTIVFDQIGSTSFGNSRLGISGEVTINGDLDDDGIPDVTLDGDGGGSHISGGAGRDRHDGWSRSYRRKC